MKTQGNFWFKATHPIWYFGNWMCWKSCEWKPANFDDLSPIRLEHLGNALKHLSWSFTHLNKWKPRRALDSLKWFSKDLGIATGIVKHHAHWMKPILK